MEKARTTNPIHEAVKRFIVEHFPDEWKMLQTAVIEEARYRRDSERISHELAVEKERHESPILEQMLQSTDIRYPDEREWLEKFEPKETRFHERFRTEMQLMGMVVERKTTLGKLIAGSESFQDFVAGYVDKHRDVGAQAVYQACLNCVMGEFEGLSASIGRDNEELAEETRQINTKLNKGWTALVEARRETPSAQRQ